MGDHVPAARLLRADHAGLVPRADALEGRAARRLERALQRLRHDPGDSRLVSALDLGVRQGGRQRRHAHRLRGAPLADRRLAEHIARHHAGRSDRGHAGRRHGRLAARADLLAGVHARRRGLQPLLRLHVAVHDVDAGPGAGFERDPDIRLLGAGGPLLVPADRLLVPQRLRAQGRDEGVPGHARRRPRLHGRAADHLHAGAHAGHRRHPPGRDRRHDRLDVADAVRARPLRGRGRQVRAVPAARLAARRDGRPDAGLRADPRRDDGRGRRLPGRAVLPGLRRVRDGARHGRRDRRASRRSSPR